MYLYYRNRNIKNPLINIFTVINDSLHKQQQPLVTNMLAVTFMFHLQQNAGYMTIY